MNTIYTEFNSIEFNLDEQNLLDNLRPFVENGIDFSLVNIENEAEYIEDVELPILADEIKEVSRQCRIAHRVHEWERYEELKHITNDLNYDMLSLKGRMNSLLETADSWVPTKTSIPEDTSTFETLDNLGQEYLDSLIRSVDGLTLDNFVTILEDIEHLNRNELISKYHYAAIGYAVSHRLAQTTHKARKDAGWVSEFKRFQKLYRSLKSRIELVPLYEDTFIDYSAALTENEIVTAIDARSHGINDWNLFLYSRSIITADELERASK